MCQGRQTPDSRSGLAPRASPPSLDPASCGPLTAAMGLRPSPQPEAGPWRPADTTGLFLGPRCSGRGVWGWPWQQSQLGKGWRPSWPFSPRPRPLPFRPAVGRPGLTAARSVDFPGDWGGVEMAVRTLPELPVQCLGLALGGPRDPWPGTHWSWCYKRSRQSWVGQWPPASLGQPRPPSAPLCPPRRQTSSLPPSCTSELSSRQVGAARSAHCARQHPAPQIPRAGDFLWVWEGGLWLLPVVHDCGCQARTATCPGHALPTARQWWVGGPSTSPLARVPRRPLPGAQAAGTHCVPICG